MRRKTFYRLAALDDFESELHQYNREIPYNVRSLVSENNRVQAIAAYRKDVCCGIQEAKERLRDYRAVLEAHEDFVNGADIYVNV